MGLIHYNLSEGLFLLGTGVRDNMHPTMEGGMGRAERPDTTSTSAASVVRVEVGSPTLLPTRVARSLRPEVKRLSTASPGHPPLVEKSLRPKLTRMQHETPT